MSATARDLADSRLVRFAGRALGSPVALTVLPGADPGGPPRAWAEVLDELAAVDRAMSRFRDDSEVTGLNRAAGHPRPVSGRLRRALVAADRARRLTGGRFDAAVLVDLERLGDRGVPVTAVGGAPVAPGAEGAVDRPGGRPVGLGRTDAGAVACLGRPVDLGGIGKGLAVRWALRRALAAVGGEGGALLDAGGDIAAGGRAPGDGWLIGIEDPSLPPAAGVDAAPIAVALVTAGAVATSSVRLRRWIAPDGREAHHLVDPRTGDPADAGLLAVTVAAADPVWAEVWSKALFLAGSAAIGSEARERGLAAWWVDADGRLSLTPAARERSRWVDESRVGPSAAG